MGIDLKTETPYICKIGQKRVHSYVVTIALTLIKVLILSFFVFEYIRSEGSYTVFCIIRWGVCVLATFLLGCGLIAKRSWLLLPMMRIYEVVIGLCVALFFFNDLIGINQKTYWFSTHPETLTATKTLMVDRTTAVPKPYFDGLHNFDETNFLYCLFCFGIGLVLVVPYKIISKSHYYLKKTEY